MKSCLEEGFNGWLGFKEGAKEWVVCRDLGIWCGCEDGRDSFGKGGWLEEGIWCLSTNVGESGGLE